MNALSAKPVSPRFSMRSALVHRHHAHGRQKVELIRLIGSLCHDKPNDENAGHKKPVELAKQ